MVYDPNEVRFYFPCVQVALIPNLILIYLAQSDISNCNSANIQHL